MLCELFQVSRVAGVTPTLWQAWRHFDIKGNSNTTTDSVLFNLSPLMILKIVSFATDVYWEKKRIAIWKKWPNLNFIPSLSSLLLGMLKLKLHKIPNFILRSTKKQITNKKGPSVFCSLASKEKIETILWLLGKHTYTSATMKLSNVFITQGFLPCGACVC